MPQSVLSRVAVGRPIEHDRIVFVPLFGTERQPSRLSADVSQLLITETREGDIGSVNVENPGSVDVLIPQGVLLKGGQQNRVVVQPTIVGAGMEVVVRTMCVQRGRWTGDRHLLAEGEMAPATARRIALTPLVVAGKVQRFRPTGDWLPRPGRPSLDLGPTWTTYPRYHIDPDFWRIGSGANPWAGRPPILGLGSPQEQLWLEISRYLGRVETYSSSEDLLEALTCVSESAKKNSSLKKLVAGGPLPGQTGLVVCHGRKIVSLDLFGQPELLAHYWSSLIHSALLDRPAKVEGRVTTDKIIEFVGRFEAKVFLPTPITGAGGCSVVDTSKYTGFVLKKDGVLVHAAGFRKVLDK